MFKIAPRPRLVHYYRNFCHTILSLPFTRCGKRDGLYLVSSNCQLQASLQADVTSPRFYSALMPLGMILKEPMSVIKMKVLYKFQFLILNVEIIRYTQDASPHLSNSNF